MSVSAGKYTGGFGGCRALFALAAASLWLASAGAVAPGPAWRAAPEHLQLFTPEPSHPGSYEAFTSPLSLEAAIDDARDAALLQPPGAWLPQAVVALDAFGKHGSHNPWALARLYGARRARVARGPRGDGGRVTEMWTLISPYPDAQLEHLEAGTLLIVLHLP